MPETKVCRTCGAEKPVAGFYKKRVLASGAVRYRPDCKACNIAATASDPNERERIRSATAAWRAADPDRGRQSSRESRNRHIDARRATQRADRLDPVKRQRILASHKRSITKHKVKRAVGAKAHRKAKEAHYKAYLQRYWKENPERAAEYQGRRRARKASAEGRHTSKDIKALRIKQQDRCNNPLCAVDLSGHGAVDHIVALVNGGSNWPDNLQLLCKSCNSRKRSRDNAEFLRCYAVEKEARETSVAAAVEPELAVLEAAE